MLGEQRFRAAAAIVVGHAVKHLYNGGMRAIIMPQIKIGLDLSRAQFGSLATAQSITNATSIAGEPGGGRGGAVTSAVITLEQSEMFVNSTPVGAGR